MVGRLFAGYGDTMWHLACLVNAVSDGVAAEVARRRQATGMDEVVAWITAEMTEEWV